MSLYTDLEQHIRQSYELIKQYEDIIRLSNKPKEQARSRRVINEQWQLIKHYLAEYILLCENLHLAMPEDITLIEALLSSSVKTSKYPVAPTQDAYLSQGLSENQSIQDSKSQNSSQTPAQDLQETRLSSLAIISSFLENYLWGQFLLLLLFLVGFIEGIVGVFDVPPYPRRLALTFLTLSGGLIIWGLSFIPRSRNHYHTWDRWLTLVLLIIATSIFGWLTYLEAWC
jgi:hypothetical protein